MKRNLTALALALGLTFTLAACGSGTTGGNAETPAGGNSESPAPAAQSNTPAAESDLAGDGQAENGVLTEGGGIGFAVEIMKKSEAKPALYEPTSAPGKSNQGKDSETKPGGSRANGSLALYNPDCGNYRKTRGYPCRKDEGSPCGKCGG